MKLLAVSYDEPRPDHSSGELRFFSLLSLMALEHEVSFYSIDQKFHPDRLSAINLLKTASIEIVTGTLEKALRDKRYDIVLFEFYPIARLGMHSVRVWQPAARVVVDSVDVHFHRLRSKARVTGLEDDRLEAERVRKEEMKVYAEADVVIAVSDADRKILSAECLQTPILVLPNIHVMHPLLSRARSNRLELVFVGSYKHAPNEDAMLYFCNQILPLVRQRVGSVRLRIVGSKPTEKINALAAADIEVLGYVDNTTPILCSSDISIVPLRFGGGIKGKVGEAMAHGIPVVSTSVGCEGFDFIDGTDLLIADTPEYFAAAIERLWLDTEMYEKVRANGWQYISRNLSTEAVKAMIPNVLETADKSIPKRISRLRRARVMTPHYLEKHVLWRFKV